MKKTSLTTKPGDERDDFISDIIQRITNDEGRLDLKRLGPKAKEGLFIGAIDIRSACRPN